MKRKHTIVSSASEAMSTSARAQVLHNAFPLLFVALPLIIAFALLYRNAFTLPYQDDYHVILAFATDYHQLPNWNTKLIEIATKQTNDYKLGFLHLIIGLQMDLVGHPNFTFLVGLGNLLLLPIAYLLWRTYQTDDRLLARRLMEFAPISFLFFSLTYWETLDWAMASLQNLSVILFSFLSLFILSPERTRTGRVRVLLSCSSAVLASFSSANGFLLAPIGLWILMRRRAYAGAIVWCFSFVLPLACYLYNYTPYSYSLSVAHKTLGPKMAYYFLGFLGCVVSRQKLAALVGLLVLIVTSFSFRMRFYRRNPTAFYFTVWIFATAVLVARYRAGIASRYSIYSLFLLIYCYSFLREHVPTRWPSFGRKGFYMVSVGVTVVFCLVADFTAYQNLAARRQMVLTGIALYRSNPAVNSPMIDPAVRTAYPEEAAFERVTLTEAIEQDVYSLP